MPKRDNKSGGGSNNSDNKRKKRGAEKPDETKQAKPFDSNFWSIILLAFTVFLTLTAFVPGTDGWLNIHNVVRGIFGLSIFLVIPVFFYASYIISKEENKDMIVSRIIQGALLLLLSSAIIQVVFIGDIPGEDFDAKVTGLYENGILMKSGGVLSALLGVPLVSMLGATGAKLTILLALFVIVLLMKNITVEKLFTSIKDCYGKVKDYFGRLNDESLRDNYEEEVAAGSNYRIDKAAGELVLDEKKHPALPLIDKDAAVVQIKNFFKKRFGLDDEDEEQNEELSVLLDKKAEDLTVEKTNTNTIDIPIVTEQANDEYLKKK
ncbi:MAG: DNA translocase FtsK 4TM domain-containing protein, partial [Oscillospiraceae bacterium]|nr:DNA translocase FtsK 4TM domain-containing protein [Oscillospiraceae bacterium]